MDAGCNLRYILSNAQEAGDGRVITLAFPVSPQGTRGYNLTYTHPTQHKYTSYIFPPP